MCVAPIDHQRCSTTSLHNHMNLVLYDISASLSPRAPVPHLRSEARIVSMISYLNNISSKAKAQIFVWRLVRALAASSLSEVKWPKVKWSVTPQQSLHVTVKVKAGNSALTVILNRNSWGDQFNSIPLNPLEFDEGEILKWRKVCSANIYTQAVRV
ncbi:unnamed protein product [Fraxinus pennsylvanica]|uniref:Uncharacterized protein n=1 Tax=Fraxinus pennsylvanica TaxID=56036 RepID=A0AAD2EEA2_9LAMI|nr:unnamed protein product [Fraxinus pennsylvanica]